MIMRDYRVSVDVSSSQSRNALQDDNSNNVNPTTKMTGINSNTTTPLVYDGTPFTTVPRVKN